jgi:MFS family permease
MALTQPVWSRVDEAHHVDFIIQLSHGVYPVANTTLIDPETLGVMERTGVFGFEPPGTYPAPDLTDIGTPPPGMSDRANAAWMFRHIWQLSQESIQPPAYYLLMVPVWSTANGLGGPYAGIYVLRVINALAIATLAPMAVAVARTLVPGRPEIALVSAMFAALLPGLDLNGTRVSNDAFATAMGGLVVLLAVRWAGGGWSWRRAVLMGLILGAGMLVKVTLAGLAPAVLVSALWPAAQAGRRDRLAQVLVAGAIAGACLVPWFLLNLRNYGAIMPGPSLRLSDSLPVPLNAPFVPLNLAVFELTYWSGEPWGKLPLAGPFAVFAGLLALMAPVGLVTLLRDRAARAAGPVAVAIAAVVCMVGVSMVLALLAEFEFVAPGRYAYPALPATAALFAIGVCIVLTKTLARRIASGLYAAVAMGMVVASAAGLPPPPDAGTGRPPANAAVVTAAASSHFEGLSITVERVAFDPAAGATWLDVTVTNSGPDEVEWTVPPVATDGELSAEGDYLKSTHLPGDLDPGQTVTGWLFVPLDPGLLHGGDSLHLCFPNVAVADYSRVGDVNLDLTLSDLPGRA